MSSKRTLGGLLVLCVLSASAQSQTIFADFNDNQLPPNWSLHSTTTNNNFGFANGRFFAGEADSGAYIQHALNILPMNSKLTVEWEGSVFQTSWGNFSSVRLKDSTGGLFVTSIGSASSSWGTGIQVLLQEGSSEHYWILPLTSGTYSFKSTFSDGSINFVGSINGVEAFSKSIVASALDLESIDAIRLHVYETLGPDMWIDSVSIAAVPEVSTLTFMLFGALYIAAIHRRRKGSGA